MNILFLKKNKMVREITREEIKYGLCFSDDGNKIISFLNNKIVIYDSKTFKHIRTLINEKKIFNIKCLGKYVILLTYGYLIDNNMYNIETGEFKEKSIYFLDNQCFVQKVIYSNCEENILIYQECSSYEKKIKVWNIKKEKFIYKRKEICDNDFKNLTCFMGNILIFIGDLIEIIKK